MPTLVTPTAKSTAPEVPVTPVEPTAPVVEPQIQVPKLPGSHVNAYKEEARQAIGAVSSELTKATAVIERLLARIEQSE